MLRLISALGLLFSVSSAWATAPTVVSANGASGFSLPGTTTNTSGTLTTTGTVQIFGGIAGSCTGDNVNTCNSCTAAAITANTSCTTQPLCACNTARIYDGLTLQINLTPPSGVTGNACIAITPTGGTKTYLPQVGSSETTNGGNYVQVSWTALCQALGSTCNTFTGTTNQLVTEIWIDSSGNGCSALETSGEDPVTVYIKVLNPGSPQYDVYGNPAEGIGGFTPYPGDGKIYLEDLNSTTGFPTLTYSGGTRANSVRVFMSPNSLDDANYFNNPLDPKDLSVVDGGDSLERNIVDGLSNDTLYFFRVALVDEANNVVQFFPDRAATDSAGTAHPECTAAGPATSACPFSATPTQVLGLLTKDFNCFIATAAYGSPLEPKLQVFRDFRHRILLTTRWGIAFTKAYYTYGPAAAQFIADKPTLRAVVRGLLWPLYGFSFMALRFGFAQALSLSLLALSALIFLTWFALRRTLTRA